MTPDLAERAAVQVGVISLAIGGALLVAPERVGAAGGFTPRAARVVGAGDVVVGAGLLAGRPRWAWMAGRGGLNLLIVRHGARRSREGVPRAGLLARALVGATVVDTAVATVLARAGR